VLYKNYVQFYPKAPNVEIVRGQITKLEEAVAAAESAKTSPPRGTAEHTEPEPTKPPPPTETPPPPVTAPPPAPTVTATATAQPSAASTERPTTPVYKKWWLWTIVGVVVVGAAVDIAVALTTPSGPWQTAKDFGPGAALTASPSASFSRFASPSPSLQVRW